ncbi:MAG TPA: DUF6520 family protein [Chitinophagales bacterium]|nr:DUF6520 family protein [Chitinophagales bacterium]
MRKLKMILPMLAFILAIGMSFAFVKATPKDFYVTGYIQIDSIWYPVDVDCGDPGAYFCVAKIENETELYVVHAAPSTTAPKFSSESPDFKPISDPRLNR